MKDSIMSVKKFTQKWGTKYRARRGRFL